MPDVSPNKRNLPLQGGSDSQLRNVFLRRRGDGKQRRDALWWQLADFTG